MKWIKHLQCCFRECSHSNLWPSECKGHQFSKLSVGGGIFFKVRILTLLRVMDFKVIVHRDYKMLPLKSWVCYLALMNLRRDWDDLENKVKKWMLTWKPIIVTIIKYSFSDQFHEIDYRRLATATTSFYLEGWVVKYLTARIVVSVTFSWNQ